MNGLISYLPESEVAVTLLYLFSRTIGGGGYDFKAQNQHTPILADDEMNVNKISVPVVAAGSVPVWTNP